MESLFVLIPITFLLLGMAVAAYVWSVGSGQFEDLDKAAHSILFDEDPQHRPAPGPDSDSSTAQP